MALPSIGANSGAYRASSTVGPSGPNAPAATRSPSENAGSLFGNLFPRSSSSPFGLGSAFQPGAAGASFNSGANACGPEGAYAQMAHQILQENPQFQQILQQAGMSEQDFINLATRITKQESGFKPDADNGFEGTNNCHGLMQLKAETAEGVAKRFGLAFNGNLSDPHVNATMGIGYLMQGLQMYGNNPDKLILGYHDGYASKAAQTGDPTFATREGKGYLASIKAMQLPSSFA